MKDKLDKIVTEIGTLVDELEAHPASDVEYWWNKRLEGNEN
jgi:hypothetical protein